MGQSNQGGLHKLAGLGFETPLKAQPAHDLWGVRPSLITQGRGLVAGKACIVLQYWAGWPPVIAIAVVHCLGPCVIRSMDHVNMA